MSGNIIDRRQTKQGKSSENRGRFIRRFRQNVKKTVKEAINKGNITDIIKDKNSDVIIPKKDVIERHFHHGDGGVTGRVFPGNKEYKPGDRIPKPKDGKGKGNGSGASNSDETSEDEFIFQISREEFLDIFFEDLELPDMDKKTIAKVTEEKPRRAGFTIDGPQSNLDYIETSKKALGRRLALKGPKKKKIKTLEEKISVLESEMETATEERTITIKEEISELNKRISALKNRSESIPYIDTMDLRYRNFKREKFPVTQAAMIFIMDVSGSMGEFQKDLAKRLFMLMYLFLTRNYENVDVVFIRHHTAACEVDEQEFFYSRETGGTMVSSALELTSEIISKRYRSDWNVYIAQASDGDNWPNDTTICIDHLDKIMHMVQHYFYVEIAEAPQEMWNSFEEYGKKKKRFHLARVMKYSHIYNAIRKLFKKKV